MTTTRERLAELRREHEEERDLIEEKIDLLDQYLALDDTGVEGKRQPDTSERPTPPRKKKVVSRKKSERAPKITPPKPPAPKPSAKRPEPDQKPLNCGAGKLEVVEDSNMDKVVSVIRDRAPHWMSHKGIAEGADAMGLRVPKTFAAIIHQECLKLRSGKYKVPGLEYKTVGRRVEYRMPKTGG